MFKEIALKIAKKEVGKKEVNIAQINEILKNTLIILANDYNLKQITELLSKYTEG